MIRKSLLPTAILSILAIAAPTTVAASADRWLHIRVTDESERGEKVRVNLPLSMLEKVAGAIDFEEIDGTRFRGGRIRIDDDDLGHVDLRTLWNAVKDAGDMEFVRVESPDGDVRVARDGGYMLVRVRSKRDDRDGEKVDVKVPLAVVDALLSAEERELDLRAALQALAETGDGELVVVKDGSSSVRIWIDDSNTSE